MDCRAQIGEAPEIQRSSSRELDICRALERQVSPAVGTLS